MRNLPLSLFLALASIGCWSWGEQPEARECAGPGDYCECDVEGLEVPCYLTPEVVGESMICRRGVRTCADGMFTTCEDVEEYSMGVTHALIEGPDECNSCNPACQVNRDRPNDADLTPGNSSDVSYCPGTGGLCPDPNMTMPEDECIGPPCGDPFDLMMGDASGLAIDPSDGALILDSSAFNPDYIWIANTGDGTISKFDILTGEEEGRYYPGPFGGGNDPSRTSINTSGDAFVGGRDGIFISRISADGDMGGCPDTNGDGMITTSSDLNSDGVISTNMADGEILPFGSDDCLLWYRDLRSIMPGGKVRAVAAQDLIDVISGSVQEFVWVGGYNDRRIALLDGPTGAILRTKDITGAPYGFALDRDQNLWISTISTNIYRVDTTVCNAAGCPASAECVGDTAACAAAAVQRISVPRSTYGVTVDFRQRVWFGGNGEVTYYDESLPAGSRVGSSTTSSVGGGWRAGIAADGLGNVWTTGSFGVIRIDGQNPSSWVHLPVSAPSQNARGWGVAIDSRDNAWVIGRWDNRAWKFVPAGGPATGLNNWTVTTEATSIRSPYTYSDMTGAQLRLAAAQRGTYHQIFEGCAAGVPQWDTITWDADVPANTYLTWRARTGDTLAALAASTWAAVGVVGAIPGAITSPADVRTPLQAAGLNPLARYLELELTLISADSDPTMVVTPRVREFSAQHTCITPTIGVYIRDYDTTLSCTRPGECAYWQQFDYFSAVPPTTTISFNIRAGDTPAAVAAATPSVYSIPPNPENGSFDMGNWLMSNGQPANPIYLQIEANLLSSATASPTLIGFDLVYTCVPCE